MILRLAISCRKFGEDYSAPHKMNHTGGLWWQRISEAAALPCATFLSMRCEWQTFYDKHMNNGGIYMTALKLADEKATGVARFKDITVEGCLYTRQAVGESLLIHLCT